MIMKYLPCLLLVLVASNAFAFPLEKMPENGVLRGKFTEERELPGFKAPLRSSGNFIVTAEGIIWQTTEPFESTMIMTEKGIKQKIDGEETLNLSAEKVPFFAKMHKTIKGMMQGEWQLMEQVFVIKHKEEKNYWQAYLVPRQKDAAIPINEMTVKGNRFVENVSMTRSDGSLDKIRFYEQKLSTSSLTAAEKSALQAK